MRPAPMSAAVVVASTAMTPAIAAWYEQRTHGQLRAAAARAGTSYLYAAQSTPDTAPGGATAPSAP